MASAESKVCQNCKASFVIDASDFDFYKKISVPPPTWCPECRAWRRFAFRDYRALYKRKSDWSGQEIFSIFSKTAPFKVYERDVWWSDQWDPLRYGRSYDFSKPFFTQLKELTAEVPVPAQTVWDLVNSDYSAGSHGLKNCYLVFVATYSEDCMYSAEINHVKTSLDLTRADSTEFSYYSFGLNKCYRTFFSSHCDDCIDVWFSRDLQGCSNCFGCANLRNKNYYIFNEPHSKEEYAARIKEINLKSYKSFRNARVQAEKFFLKHIVRFARGRRNTNISGEYINNSKNVRDSYYVNSGEDCKYVQYLFTPSARDCVDVTQWGDGIELVYEASSCGVNSSRIKFSYRTYRNSSDCEYCMHCVSSSNLFGCVGMQSKQYCILNKQYTKEEYETLVSRIKRHMDTMPYVDGKERIYRYGEFFPPGLSLFAYNETLARDQFPRTKEEALADGFLWNDLDDRNYVITVLAENLPDYSTDVSDSITKEVIGCLHKGVCNHECTTAFRITATELQFYRQMNLHLPRLCHNCRHHDRIRVQSPMRLWHRTCQCAGIKSENGAYQNSTPHFHGSDHCSNEFETSYAPDQPEIVYCEQCYNAEVA